MKASGFLLRIENTEGEARTGTLTTPHGRVSTPAFMPVATFGAVRGISAADLQSVGAQILLSNTYHLHERPGEETVASLGGLHGFTGWSGPWLTDSGGYQVTSLSDRMKIDEDGVIFASPLDGKKRRLSPEGVIQIQESLGSDIAMVLDECLPALQKASPEENRTRMGAAMMRSLRWAERAARARRSEAQAVFGIVQGGIDETLRQQSAEELTRIGFDGAAHGGLGLGESRAQRMEAVRVAHSVLPSDQPRYLMGLGRPIDLIDGIACGIDLFDCVVPTRNGRHGLLFTSQGILSLKNAVYRSDERPIDPNCDCPACVGHSRGYLRHLFKCGEALAPRLAALHNLRFYLSLLEQSRQAISEGGFAAFRSEMATRLEHRLAD